MYKFYVKKVWFYLFLFYKDVKLDSKHSLMPLLNVHSMHMTYLVSKNKWYWVLNCLAYDLNFFSDIHPANICLFFIFFKLGCVTVIGHFNIIWLIDWLIEVLCRIGNISFYVWSYQTRPKSIPVNKLEVTFDSLRSNRY